MPLKKVLFALALGLTAAPSLSAEDFIRLRGAELVYGAYDISAAPIISFSSLDYLMVKPLFVRFNPFTLSVAFGSLGEYFPLSQFHTGWLIFSDSVINPFVYTGYKLTFDFKTVTFPVGAGFQGRLFSDFFAGFKVYVDLTAGKVMDANFSWDVSLEYKLK